MPIKTGNGLYIEVSASEKELLEQYCKLCDRTKSDVVRELIRGLRPKLRRLQKSLEDSNLDISIAKW